MRLNIKTTTRFSDCDNILLHAAFGVLCNFIEKEKPEELSNDDLIYEGAEKQNDDLRRLKCLYYWWRYIRPKLEDAPIINYTDRYDFDTARLQELISLRGSMWT